jgi:hypothetical protein
MMVVVAIVALSLWARSQVEDGSILAFAAARDA